MFKSEIDDQEIKEGGGNGIIIEVDEEDQTKKNNEYEIAKGVPSFMDTFKTPQSKATNRPFSAIVQNKKVEFTNKQVSTD